VFFKCILTLNLLTTTIVALPSNASKWQMGFNLAFKGLKHKVKSAYNPSAMFMKSLSRRAEKKITVD